MTHANIGNTYRVLVGLDFSSLGDRAILEALRACRGHEQPELHVLVVASEEAGLLRLPGDQRQLLTQDQADALARDHLATLLATNEALVLATGLDQVAVYVTPGWAAERIVALATAIDVELIVIGTHSRSGLSRLVLGSVAEEVVRTAPCGVLVIRPRDFLKGEKLPDVAPPLKPGEHSLKPFAHAPTFHYVRREQSSSVMPAV